MNQRKEKHKLLDDQNSESDTIQSILSMRDKLIAVFEKHNALLNGKTLTANSKKDIVSENCDLIKELKELKESESNNLTSSLETTIKTMQEDLKIIKKSLKNSSNYVRVDRNEINISNDDERVCVIEPNGRSYAEVLKNLNECNLIKDKIRINNVYTTKKNLVIAKTKTKEDRDKLIENCVQVGLTARNVKDKMHRYVLRRLPSEKEEIELINELLARRSDTDVIKKSFKVVKMFTSKNGKKVMVFNVDSNGAKAIEQDLDFYIGYQRHRATVYVNLIQCYKCFGFGHIAKDCKEDEVCGNCSETHSEPTNECTKSDKIHVCVNCKKEGKQGADTHTATSNLCPIKQEHRKRLIDGKN